MTLALLITAVGGAWAEDYTTVFELNGSTASTGTLTLGSYGVAADIAKIHENADDIAAIKMSGNYSYSGGCYFTIAPETGSFKKGDKVSIAVCINSSDVTKSAKAVIYADDHETLLYTTAEGINGRTTNDDPVVEEYVLTQDADLLYIGRNGNTATFVTTLKVVRPASAEPGIDVTTNAASEQDLFTEASFTMPAFDATADYELVRDMQDKANPVAFSGLPSSGNIIVKKGSDGKYQPAEALTIQLIDPLAAEDAKNIIAADGITIKVLVGDGGTPIEYDQDNPITLEAFLADMKPGYYWIKAEPTDENSPYDGTVYSSQFTAVEQYDLTVKPANDFSKNGLDAVTVGSESVTIDATTGKVTKEGIDPGTEVKIKAKRGYVIDKVEAKKTSTPN